MTQPLSPQPPPVSQPRHSTSYSTSGSLLFLIVKLRFAAATGSSFLPRSTCCERRRRARTDGRKDDNDDAVRDEKTRARASAAAGEERHVCERRDQPPLRSPSRLAYRAATHGARPRRAPPRSSDARANWRRVSGAPPDPKRGNRGRGRDLARLAAPRSRAPLRSLRRGNEGDGGGAAGGGAAPRHGARAADVRRVASWSRAARRMRSPAPDLAPSC